jgi:hypothetical protein
MTVALATKAVISLRIFPPCSAPIEFIQPAIVSDVPAVGAFGIDYIHRAGMMYAGHTTACAPK